MLDIGWSELLLVAIVAIVVVGPKELPKLMRTVGVYLGKVRRMAGDFQRQFNEAIAESEADEVRKNLESIQSNLGSTPDLSQPIGKPLMTGPLPTPASEFVTHNQPQEPEPALPPAKKAANEKAATKKAAMPKKTGEKSKMTRKKTAPKKTAPQTTAIKKAATKMAVTKKAPSKSKRRAKSSGNKGKAARSGEASGKTEPQA